jgi:hypothetical protein
MRTILFSALMIGLVSLIAAPAVNAQSNQLEESQKAVLVFDFRFDKLKSSDAAKSLKIAEKIKSAKPSSDDMPNPDKIVRVFGAASAPEDISEIQGFKGEGPLPVEFFSRIEMEDAASLNEAMEKLMEKSEVVEMGGKTYYKPNEEDAPENIMATKVNDTTIEFGTTAYITRADRKVFTDGLTAAWQKSPDDAVRLAIDLEGASSLIEAAVAQGKESAPPNFAPFIDLLSAASDLRISMDFEGENLLTIGTTGKSESEAEDLEGGLNTLVGFGQMFGTQAVQGLKQQSEELGTMAEGILKSLEAVRDGDSVVLAIPRPEGFAEALKGLEE